MTPLKLLGLGTVLLSVLSAGTVSHAQDWPNRPVKVVVPFAAAGTTDRLGRIAAEELSKTFKQQFYVENRVGGGGVVGAVQVARADPDGYTLMIGGYGPHIFAPATTANLGYDALSDFTHIAMIGGESFIIVAHPALGVKSFADLVQLAKSRSGPLNMASPGQSTLGALVVEQLIRKPGLLPNLNHVPYRGGGPVMADLLGNHVSLGCIVLSAAIEHIHSGTLVPLALIATERAQALKGCRPSSTSAIPTSAAPSGRGWRDRRIFPRRWLRGSTRSSADPCRRRSSSSGSSATCSCRWTPTCRR